MFRGNRRAVAQDNRQGVSYQWSPDCQVAFECLKQALITSPILAMPTDADRYVLNTDASNHSIGAVLSQIQAGEGRVIAYGSRTYKAEVNYCTTRKELLAVVYFVKQFKQYLLGREFLVKTDHAALTWLLENAGDDRASGAATGVFFHYPASPGNKAWQW